jgi:hypothetical protein
MCWFIASVLSLVFKSFNVFVWLVAMGIDYCVSLTTILPENVGLFRLFVVEFLLLVYASA